jgi:transcriptional regulator of heat shock response
MDRLKGLFDAFSQKRGIIHLLDKCLEADGVQIYIGEESGYKKTVINQLAIDLAKDKARE